MLSVSYRGVTHEKIFSMEIELKETITDLSAHHVGNGRTATADLKRA